LWFILWKFLQFGRISSNVLTIDFNRKLSQCGKTSSDYIKSKTIRPKEYN
jgi:hypothetical protein